MTHKNNNGAEFSAPDFAPDLSMPKENLTKQPTSIKFDSEVYQSLQDLKESKHLNASKLVNGVVKDYLQIAKELEKDVYNSKSNDFIKVELVLHKEMAEYLLTLINHKGAIPVANKLLEVLACEQSSLISQNDCNVYGNRNNLTLFKERINRAKHRLQEEQD